MNKVILMGRLTKDPELRYTNSSNIPVASFSLAVNRRFQKQGEERKADFINCVAWNKSAEFVKNYFKKGQQVGVIGRMQTRTWDDDQGKRHYATDVVVEETYFADSKKDQGQGGYSQQGQQQGGYQQQGQQGQQGGYQQQPAANVPAKNDFVTIEDDDDDLPF